MLASARDSAFRSHPHTPTASANASTRRSPVSQGRDSGRRRRVKRKELSDPLPTY